MPSHLAEAAQALATAARADPAYQQAREWLSTILRADRPRTREALVLVRSVCAAKHAADGERVDEPVMVIALADLGVELRGIRGKLRCNLRESLLVAAAATPPRAVATPAAGPDTGALH